MPEHGLAKNYLFIGLGGQGGRTIAELRKVMAERSDDKRVLDDQDIKFDFVSIDSSPDVWNTKNNWKYFGEDLSLKESQKIFLKQVQINVEELALRPDVAPWMGDQETMSRFAVGEGAAEGGLGANQRRRFGRALFAEKATDIKEDLLKRIGRLTAGTENKCWIHIFATIAGGTGSGGIVDLVTMLRNAYPDSEEFRIFVHVYVTDSDDQGAGVGYFFQNQYATLRDLNALMAGQFKPHLVGATGGGKLFEGKKPCNAVVISTNLNSQNQNIPLKNQIRITAEVCFERIFSTATGSLNEESQKAITLEDLASVFPGEPSDPSPRERSYRFSALGIRRWEVPNEKMEELICKDLICSSLKQMLANNWQDGSGYITDNGQFNESKSERILSSLDQIVNKRLVSKSFADESKELLDRQFKEISLRVSKEEGALPDMETEVEKFYERDFHGEGARAYFGNFQVKRKESVKAILSEVDQALSEAFLRDASPLGLRNAIEALTRFDAVTREKIDQDLPDSSDSTRARMNARSGEWEKMTFLSKGIKAEPLMRAHLKDLRRKFFSDFDSKAAQEDKELRSAMLGEIINLRNKYAPAREVLEDLLARTENEKNALDTELRNLQDGQSANVYEFNQENLDDFRKAVDLHQQHQRATSSLMRQQVCELNRGKILSRFINDRESERESLIDRLEQVAKSQVKEIHFSMTQDNEVKPVLNDSVMDRLQKRFAGNQEQLKEAAKDFISKAASCSRQSGDMQPSVMLGGNINVPPMPRRRMIIAHPEHPFAEEIVQALKDANPGGEGYFLHTYKHDDPSQLRLMVADYWMAARFHKVCTKLKEEYQNAAQGITELNVPYFCNIDPDGQNNKRPDLMLPEPSQLRHQLEAAIWISERLEPPASEQGNAGFCLLRQGQGGQVTSKTMGESRETFIATADLPQMFTFKGEITRRISQLDPATKQTLKDQLSESENAIKEEHGAAGDEFQQWQRVRDEATNLLG